jgi:hypothetical protein
MFSAEQTAKGVIYLQQTYQKLVDVESKFGAIGTTLSNVSSKLDSLVDNLAPMSDISSNLVEMNKTLKQLTERLPKS